ncbi:MAG: bifunctional D-glycero-beta-D-manno-heptose-7-phosphate kinase/D-glycero-beta-D-manno-heptose 1-phosphate adenylyltransferase HldE [Gammaproteobacteria bacterium]|nr:bifunctional D-glycero-beta-D-manno-heptose-7-phosphate kinase/D-glycero-beta-D-manno-heptose 1-phosphate adenylyltransferase HldE [Gammaproteobacteria bacterium]
MDVHVLVVGDVMLDRYWHADANRISPEAPVPVASITDTHDRAGGAANVAQNISALGSQVTLLGAVGNDQEGEVLQTILQKQNIHTDFIYSASIRTTSKIRIVSRNQQLIRLDFDDKAHSCGAEVDEAFLANIENCSIVILSDYGKGVLSDAQEIIRIAVNNNKKVIVDPKGSDFSKYKNASVITPNYSEFCAVVGECDSEQDICQKAQKLCVEYNFEALLITRSEKGMTLVMQDGAVTNFPAQMREVYDVTGAGDTVISAFAMSLAADADYNQAARVANIAASIVVGKFGAATVSAEELTHGMLSYECPNSKLVSAEFLAKRIEDAHAKNQVVVFTNGCFDVLHKGHAHLLREASTFGDMVVVALNSDNSVRRLKGDERPINHLQDRAEMLSYFSSVDWVVSFEEETPEALIQHLNPDVLVKGGDYQADEIVGSKYVCDRGGEVKIIPFVEGYSTSNIISSIINKD